VWLVAVPLAAALGPYLLPIPLAGINLYAFRLLIILSALTLPFAGRGVIRFGINLSVFYFGLGLLWIIWGLLSLLWAPDLAAGVTEITALAFGFLTALLMLNLGGVDRGAVAALRTGWLLAFLASAAIAGWEIVTHRHLPSYFSAHAPAHLLLVTVVSTFGHPNNFAAFLTIAFPFLLWSSQTSHGLVRWASWLSLIVLPFLLIVSGGRLGILAVVMQLGLLLMLRTRSMRSAATWIVIVVAGLALLSVSLRLEPTTLKNLLNLQTELQTGGSVGIRVNLVREALSMTARSSGLGVGAGGFEPILLAGHGVYDTSGIVNPHNFWMEIMAQYGVLPFMGFAGWLIAVAAAAIRGRRLALRAGNAERRFVSEALLIALVGYIFAAVENSSYIGQPMNWIFLGSVLLLAVHVVADPAGAQAVDGNSRHSTP